MMESWVVGKWKVVQFPRRIIIKNTKHLTNSENYVIISKIYFWPSQIRSLK